MQAAEFHGLAVLSVEHLTDDSVRVTFDVPPNLEETYSHLPGQHIAVRAIIDGDTIVRSYSVCSRVKSGLLQIGVKRLDGGAFSSFANASLHSGDIVEVAPPVGEFVITTDSLNTNHYIAIVAGSGITPVLSMIETVLEEEPKSQFTLIYGNRFARTVMFLADLDRLKNHHMSRLSVFHVLSRETSDVRLFSGRLDEEKLESLLRTVVDARSATAWFLCGPTGVVEAARSILERAGVSSDVVHDELFYANDSNTVNVAEGDVVGSRVKVTIDGRTSELIVDPEGAPILDHVLSVRPEAPSSCRSGACATCRATVTVGEVVMDRNWALDEEQIARGQILTCQAHPVSGVVELTYDI